METIKTCNLENTGSFSISCAKISNSYDLMKVFDKSTARKFRTCAEINLPTSVLAINDKLFPSGSDAVSTEVRCVELS